MWFAPGMHQNSFDNEGGVPRLLTDVVVDEIRNATDISFDCDDRRLVPVIISSNVDKDQVGIFKRLRDTKTACALDRTANRIEQSEARLSRFSKVNEGCIGKSALGAQYVTALVSIISVPNSEYETVAESDNALFSIAVEVREFRNLRASGSGRRDNARNRKCV